MEDGRAQPMRFGPTSGVAVGIIGLLACAVVAVAVLVDGGGVAAVRVALAAGLAAVLTWAYLLRPRILLTAEHLVLRNPWTEVRLGVASVRDVTVRSFTRVSTQERTFDAVAVGYPLRKLSRERRSPRAGLFGEADLGSIEDPPVSRGRKARVADIQAVMVEQIGFAAEQARLAGRPVSVARRWALVEVVAAIVLAAALAISFAW